MDKNLLTQRFQQALLVHGQGNPAAAESIYQEIAEAMPESADAWYLWGLAAQEMGKHEDAITRFSRAIAIGGNQADMLHNLGTSLQALGRLVPAAQCFYKALAISPDNPHFLASLGNLTLEQKEFQQAESFYQKALAIKEDFPQVHYNLGTLYKGQSQDAKATNHFKRTLELDPDHWKAHFSYGLMVQFDNRTQEAVTHFNRAIQLKPGYLRAHWAKHTVLPTFYDSEGEIALARQCWFEGVAELARTFFPKTPEELEEARHACESATNFYLNYQGQNDLEAQKAQGGLLTRIAHTIFPGYNQPLPLKLKKPGEKIHVVFVSTFLYGHSIFKTHSRFITHLNRNRFFVTTLFTGNIQDESLKIVMQGTDSFQNVGQNSPRLIAAILAANPDVLIYTDLGMDPMLNLVSALRLAPVQCNAGGHPVTSGLASMDYFLTSDAMEVSHAQEHYSETLIRLPNLAHCYPTPQSQWAIAPPGTERSPGVVVYCNLQNLIKLLPQHDSVYPDIALEVPNSRFWFIDPKGRIGEIFRARMDRVFRVRGLDYENHCQFFPKMKLTEFFGLIRASDIILDGIAWSGNNSSMETLSLNKPIVTLPGEMFRNRHTHGILKRLGITETQASSLEHYVSIAVRLGKDPEFREEITQTIAARKHLLYEDLEPIRGLEKALEAIFAA